MQVGDLRRGHPAIVKLVVDAAATRRAIEAEVHVVGDRERTLAFGGDGFPAIDAVDELAIF